MIKQSIGNPYAAFVGMAIVVMFGLLALMTIPIQLKPVIEPTEIQIQTFYWGASPLEVEDQITNKIEDEVSGINDLKRVESNSQEGVSTVNLIFTDSADKNKALIDTVQAMKRVTDLPELAQEPTIKLVTGAQGEQIMWVSVEGGASIDERWDMISDVVQPALERVDGVGQVQFFGGVDRKIVVQPDPDKLAQRDISMGELARVISTENLNSRGGYIEEGDRQFMVRTLGKYTSLKDVAQTVIRHGPDGTVTVGDVATVIDGRDRQVGFVHVDGKPAIAMGIDRQSDANTVTTIRAVREEIDHFNQRFKDAGVDIHLREVYSELPYVQDAIRLVRNNLFIGAILAALVLALFLRAGRPILIVVITIPVSLISVFIVLQMLGRTINIISLAGIAFSVGIVVDNAIVVLENMDRHMRELGKPPVQAALDSITEISGAIFASTMTTVAVFIPIVLNTTEAGLLFKDIAIAVVSAVLMSLLAAYFLVPSVGALLIRTDSLRQRIERDNPQLSRVLDIFEFQWLGRAVERGYAAFLSWACSGRGHGTTGGRVLLLGAILLVFFGTMRLLPSANYLPNGTREFIFCFARPLVGQRNDVTMDVLKPVEDFSLADPRVDGVFAVSANPFFTGVGVVLDRAKSTEQNLQDLAGKLTKLGFQLPGLQLFVANRTSIFNTTDKSFTIEVTGPELSQLKKTTDAMIPQLFGMHGLVTMAFTQYVEGVPELNVVLDRYRVAEQGLNLLDVAQTVEMLLGGREVSTYTDQGREYDLLIRASKKATQNRADLAAFTFVTPKGDTVRLDEIADIREGTGPSEIRHYNRQRSIQVTVNTNPKVPTQVALDAVQKNIMAPLEAQMPPGYSVRFGEAADKLRQTLSSLVFQGLLAIVIVYLLMVALFRSFSYPLVILVTIPLAWSGSFLALGLAYMLTGGIVQLDVLGMLGLIILTGIVVNNAILIVHQMINNRDAGMAPLDALKESARTRLRPIFMSVLTSVFGMLPLALGHGSGSELYRGLGIVVIGGMLVSTVFTLFVVPTILSLIEEARDARRKRYEARNHAGQ